MDEQYDVVIIGAGHNGLVAAAYLLKAGYSVLLLERHATPGGACTTDELMPDEAPGFRFSPCAIDHLFVFLGPVVEELELEKYGLKYLYCDPVVYCPHPDGRDFLAHRSVEKTCAEIARVSERDARFYREFIDYWQRVMGVFIPLFNAPPKNLLDIAGNFDFAKLKDLASVVGPPNKTLDFARNLLTSPREIIEEYFDSEVVRAPLARLAGELSTPPSQKGQAFGAVMMAMRHEPGMARPKGGSGAFTEALLNLVHALGGVVRCSEPVAEVLVDDGRAVGVRTDGGRTVAARYGVISNIDARKLFGQLVDPAATDAADPDLRERLTRKLINSNETILKIDCALAEAPRFERWGRGAEVLSGSLLIADSVNHVEEAHNACIVGRIPDDDPSMYIAVPSVLDPSLAPEGKHTLWIEFFAPYKIAGAEGSGLSGTGWTDALKNKVADRVIDKLAEYAPNLKRAIIARRVESPAELAVRLGTHKGNYYHYDMTIDYLMFFRPLPELANYKTPIDGLYLTGAGTHPGGSVSGMPGRNTARVFLHDREPLKQTALEAGRSLGATLGSLYDQLR